MISHTFAFSQKGCDLALRLHPHLIAMGHLNICHTTSRFSAEYAFQTLEHSLTEETGKYFTSADFLIFISAAGIAVRAIAPYIRSKETDPGVIVIDDCGTFTISLLSGHLGGANQLTKNISNWIDSTPVITTATDRNQRFSADGWAANQQLKITDMAALKAVSAAILENNIPITADFSLPDQLPPGLYAKNSGELGISISYRKNSPFSRTLHIVPPVLRVGIGCRRGTKDRDIQMAIDELFNTEQLQLAAIASIASIDLKKDEPGLLTYCQKKALTLTFYSATELQDVQGDFTASAFVESITGVDNVCERAALKSSQQGTLIVSKTSRRGITLAVALDKWRIPFDEHK